MSPTCTHTQTDTDTDGMISLLAPTTTLTWNAERVSLIKLRRSYYFWDRLNCPRSVAPVAVGF